MTNPLISFFRDFIKLAVNILLVSSRVLPLKLLLNQCRLLEVGDAVVSKKKVSFQDKSSLPTDLTCIFVEDKLRSDVIHLQSHGISVLSPDYIPEYIIKVKQCRHINIIRENMQPT